jgi:mono/diheme cytochrome c family protein
MGRLLKGLAILVGVVVLVVLVAVGVIYTVSGSKMSKTYAVEVTAPPIPTGVAAIAEGQRVFTSRGCADCHGQDLAGVTFVDDPAVGHFAGANLTTGKGGVGSALKDADIVRAVRHGVAADGRALIFMPSTDFFAMNDADIGAIIAYMRSVPPVDKPAPVEKPGPIARVLFLLGKMPILVPANVIDHSGKPSTVAVGLTVEYGRYLANGCTGCHGEGFSGGPIPGGAPDWPPAKNLTPSAATGVGKWSEADFIKAVREGVLPDGARLKPPMPWQNFSKLTDTEVKALWMFLKTVPAKEVGNR